VAAVGSVPTQAEEQARDEFLFQAMHTGVETGDFSALEAAFSAVGVRWSAAGIALTQWYEVTDLFRQRMTSILFSYYRADHAKLRCALTGLERYLDQASRVITTEYVRERERLWLEERRSAERVLLLYKHLSDSGIIGVLRCDVQGRVSDANDTFLSIVGRTREELATFDCRGLIPPDLRRFTLGQPTTASPSCWTSASAGGSKS
jgi:PAS domain-containing protein